jgi:hypothetical protein
MRGEFKSAEPTIVNDRPYGPLTYEEKVHIRDNRQHESATVLANEYNTSTANIRNAQHGKFKAPRQAHTHTRPYGPLTYTEKVHIREHRRDERPSELAREFNTSDLNIIRAQRGEFARKKDSKPDYTHILNSIPRHIIKAYLEKNIC